MLNDSLCKGTYFGTYILLLTFSKSAFAHIITLEKLMWALLIRYHPFTPCIQFVNHEVYYQCHSPLVVTSSQNSFSSYTVL